MTSPDPARTRFQALADEYAAAVVTPLYLGGETPTPYERGLLRQIRQAFMSGVESALLIYPGPEQSAPPESPMISAWPLENIKDSARANVDSAPPSALLVPEAESGPADELHRELLLWLDDSDVTAQFEAIGDKFYAESGFLRPGKAEPLVMNGGQEHEERRQEAWRSWCVNWRRSLVQRLRAALLVPAQPEHEICICAAIRLDDGTVLRGHRHDDCFQTAQKYGYGERITQAKQGFVTSRNRFVDRVEGMTLQRAAGLKSAHHPSGERELHGDTLFSEDLYFSLLVPAAPPEPHDEEKKLTHLAGVPEHATKAP